MDGSKIQLNFLKEIFRKINPFFIFGILISALVAIPVVIVVGSFLEDTSEYFLLMKNTFLIVLINTKSVIKKMIRMSLSLIYKLINYP